MKYSITGILFAACVLCCAHVSAQITKFNGVLINKRNNQPVSIARIQLLQTKEMAITEDDGSFILHLPDKTETLMLNVAAIGVHDTIRYALTHKKVEKVYIDIAPGALEEVSFTGLSPESVLRKAVAAIPDNYASHSFVAYCSYRDYDRINNIFRDLSEGDIAIMRQVTKTKKGLSSKDGFAVRKYRRLLQFQDYTSFYDDNIADLMPQDPIYNLPASAIYPNRFAGYKFHFDTTAPANEYIVCYSNPYYSCDHHGVITVGPWIYSGESNERGRIVIDRSTYAIKRIERYAYRNPEFPYMRGGLPTNVLHSGKYYFEFVEGSLITEYAPINGTWYMTSMNYSYNNDLFKTFWGSMNYHMVTCFEWRLDSLSDHIPASMANSFFLRMGRDDFSYDKDKWSDFNFPYYFYPKDTVYSYLQRRGPVDDQFLKQAMDDRKKYVTDRE